MQAKWHLAVEGAQLIAVVDVLVVVQVVLAAAITPVIILAESIARLQAEGTNSRI